MQEENDSKARSRNRKRRRMQISKLPFALLMRYLAQGFIRFGPRPFRNPNSQPAEPAQLRPAA
ncbi:MAG: hypothetical protein SFV51_15630 [Bryobacteraceae bacterium]|nr:hypothetical protein [Bryobacteraceae bacterium]